MIKQGSRVTFHYTLSVDDEVVGTSRDGDPLTYVHGQEQIVPGLEEQLEGMSTGDKTTATVAPDKGYGERRADALHKVPRSAIENASTLKRGDVVSGQAQGQKFQAKVADVGPDEITLDLNHPLAGKTLEFEVEILEVA